MSDQSFGSTHWDQELSLSDTQEFIRDIDGDVEKGIYAVGSAIFKRDNNSWSKISIPELNATLNALTVVNADDVWAVGQNGTVVHFDGIRWTVQQLEISKYHALIDVAAWADEVWVTTAGSEIFRFDRSCLTWQVLRPSIFQGIRSQAIWGLDSSNVFVEVHPQKTGTGSYIAHFDGADWTIVPAGKKGYITSIHGANTVNVWAAGYRVKLFGKSGQILRYDGHQWQNIKGPRDLPLRDISVQTPNSVWLVGGNGLLLHWQNNIWSCFQNHQYGHLTKLLALPDKLLLVGNNRTSIFSCQTNFAAK